MSDDAKVVGAIQFSVSGDRDRTMTVQVPFAGIVWIGEGLACEGDFYHSHVILPPDKVDDLIALLRKAKRVEAGMAQAEGGANP